MVNFGLLTAEIYWRVWGTPANFNGFHVLAALLHGTLVVGVSQTLRHWTAGRPSRWALAHILVQYVLQYLPPTSILVDSLRWTWVSQTVVGFLHFFWKRTGEDKRRRFSWATCASCDQTNSVKALKAALSTDINQWPGLIFSLSPTLLLRKKVLPLYTSSPTLTPYCIIYWCGICTGA